MWVKHFQVFMGTYATTNLNLQGRRGTQSFLMTFQVHVNAADSSQKKKIPSLLDLFESLSFPGTDSFVCYTHVVFFFFI